MLGKIATRLRIFLGLVKKIKNWQVIFLVYFGLFKNDTFTLVFRNDLIVKLRTSSTDIQALANVWINEEYKKTGFEIKNDDTIIDIGAHVGLFTLYASQYCKVGRIFCLEPIKNNFDLLSENVQINQLSNVKCINKAVHNKNNSIRMYLSETDNAAHSVFGNGNEHVDVNATTLSEIFNAENIQICNLLKMDCEGSEYEIFEATADEYLKKIQKICLEYHIIKGDFKPLNALKSRLATLGFQIADVSSTDNLGILYAKRE